MMLVLSEAPAVIDSPNPSPRVTGEPNKNRGALEAR